MKGKIIINADDNNLSLKMSILGVSPVERMIIVDALVNAFEPTEEDRIIWGSTIAAGGFHKVMGVSTSMVKVDLSDLGNMGKKDEI